MPSELPMSRRRCSTSWRKLGFLLPATISCDEKSLIMREIRQNGGVTVVDDQLGNPTNAADLAHEILNLLVTKEYGVYHCTGEGVCSWCEFAAEIIRLSGIPATVTPCTTEQFIAGAKKQIAPRPAYSALENAMLKATIGNEMRDWKTALACFFENYKPEE